jgi:hypothetical protein
MDVTRSGASTPAGTALIVNIAVKIAAAYAAPKMKS